MKPTERCLAAASGWVDCVPDSLGYPDDFSIFPGTIGYSASGMVSGVFGVRAMRVFGILVASYCLVAGRSKPMLPHLGFGLSH